MSTHTPTCTPIRNVGGSGRWTVGGPAVDVRMMATERWGKDREVNVIAGIPHSNTTCRHQEQITLWTKSSF